LLERLNSFLNSEMILRWACSETDGVGAGQAGVDAATLAATRAAVTDMPPVRASIGVGALVLTAVGRPCTLVERRCGGPVDVAVLAFTFLFSVDARFKLLTGRAERLGWFISAALLDEVYGFIVWYFVLFMFGVWLFELRGEGATVGAHLGAGADEVVDVAGAHSFDGGFFSTDGAEIGGFCCKFCSTLDWIF
jgi:hypothetical protein